MRREIQIRDDEDVDPVDDLSDSLKLCVLLRRFQRKSKCTTKSLNSLLQVLKPFLKCETPRSVGAADKILLEAAGLNDFEFEFKSEFEWIWLEGAEWIAGSKVLKLNGCNACHKHVFLPSDPAKVCPKCGISRYKANGEAKEVAFYFPLTPKLRALLKIKRVREMWNYEYKRPRVGRLIGWLSVCWLSGWSVVCLLDSLVAWMVSLGSWFSPSLTPVLSPSPSLPFPHTGSGNYVWRLRFTPVGQGDGSTDPTSHSCCPTGMCRWYPRFPDRRPLVGAIGVDFLKLRSGVS